MSSASQPVEIGPYRVLSMLGRGGFGTVYLAEQQVPVRREVAVKVLNPGMEASQFRDRFELERETLNLMKHPGIALLLDAGMTDDDQPYFVMEYVPGTPLREFVHEQSLSLEQRLNLFRAICDAIQHAHNKGIIHRDLTANNVLVSEIDGRPTPKVIDFGIAKSLGPTLEDYAMHTYTGVAMGTPAYMSPEQVSGDIARIDTRTDIYALGVQLYLLLTDTMPFAEAHLQAAGGNIIQMICATEPDRPSVRAARSSLTRPLAGRLRGDLDWITTRALEKRLEDRYASVAELSDDVRRFLEHEPVLAGPPTTTYRLRKVIRKHRTAAIAASGVLLALIVGLIVSTILYLQSAANERASQRNLARFNRLSEVLELEALEAEVAGLGAGRPENLAAMQGWLARADALVGKADSFRDVLANPLESADGLSEEELRASRFLSRELEGLLADIEVFAGARGPLANVRARAAWAAVVVARTVDEHAAAWEEAAREVSLDPRFDGFELTPQVGLVPLGPDPLSGLQEFCVLRTGEPPVREPAGAELDPAPEWGVVLVLVPGGEFLLGCLEGEAGAGTCPDARENESCVTVDESGVKQFRRLPLRLEAFLISKYELTQAQWERMTAGDRPSAHAGPAYERLGVTPLNPVENLTWRRSRLVLVEFGMELPTEAQWEYACRAGTDTPWFTGATEASLGGDPELHAPGTPAMALAGSANLADIWARDHGLAWGNFDGVILNDLCIYTAEVGTYRPNAFGLHDVHGNVLERCLEAYGPYRPELFSGPAARRSNPAPNAEPSYIVRGGGYKQRAPLARSTYRWWTGANTTAPDIGVRPVMALDS